MSKHLESVENIGRVAVIGAAHTGPSLAELKGLKWQGVNEHELKVQRTVWHGIKGLRKTKARENSIPLLPLVADVLDGHRKANPGMKWVFEGLCLKPRNLASLVLAFIEPIPQIDSWAFGCVLYELLTRKQAFQGETVTEILAAVLR